MPGAAAQADGPPTAPSLASPSGGGVATSPTYTWNAVEDADEYYLWVSDAAGVPVVQSWHSSTEACSGTTCAITPAVTLSRGYKQWWVQARNASGAGPWSSGLGFTVGSLPAAPILASPSGSGISPTPTFTWNALADVEDYYLWVSDATGAPVIQSWQDASAVCSGATCSVTAPAALVPGWTTWYVQARNASGTGPWSAGMTFTVGSLPGPATLIGPSGSGVSSTPAYVWGAAAGVTAYYLWVSDIAGAAVTQVWVDASTACSGATCSSTQPASLTPGWKTWWIQTRNASGDGPWSAGMSFVVGDLPGTATLVSPTGPAIETTPAFVWNAVATATAYELWVGGTSGNPVIDTWYGAEDVCSAGACAIPASQPLARGAHQWWVRARNASGDGPWSAGMSFAVGDVPGAPVPRSPSGVIATSSPTYSWDPLTDTNEYYLWVSGPAGTPVVQLRYSAAAACTTDACSAKPASPLGQGGHTWWVQARNGSGDGPWSAGMSFTVVAAGSVAAGAYSSFALTPERLTWTWGSNGYGQLGLGSTDASSTPALVASPTEVVALAAGSDHAVLLRTDGVVWVSGANYAGQLGQEGDSSSTFRPVPGLSGVVQVASGGGHVLALKSDGTVVGWGDNSWGQLGTGDLVSSFTPVPVPGLTSVVAVAAGAGHSLALKADGTVLAWGLNDSGQLGDGGNDSTAAPVAVTGLPAVRRIAAGAGAEHSFALTEGGALYAWGLNASGQLGDGSNESRATPARVVGITGVTHVAAGASHSLAVTQDGSLFSWGSNERGQLGTDALGASVPTLLVSPTGITGVAAGVEHSLALTSDGRVIAWGGNEYAQLGAGESGGFVPDPIELSGPGFVWKTAAPRMVPAGGTFVNELDAAIAAATPGAVIRYTVDGSEPSETSPALSSGEALHVSESVVIRARAWKDGFLPSALAEASFTLETAPPRANPPSGTYSGRVLVGLASATNGAEIRYTTDGSDPTAESPVYSGLLALTTTTTVKARAFRGSWAPSGVLSRSYAVEPTVGAAVAGQSFSLALGPTGMAWAWGAGENGQLGNGFVSSSPEPLRVESITNALAVAGGSTHAAALRQDGSVLVWGAGQLTPMTLAGVDSIVALAAGGAHTLALRGDGHVFAWGQNSFGQLGDGTTDERAVPALVPGVSNVVAIAAGEAHSMALSADGRVWVWGDNGWGQVGDGSGFERLSPVAVMQDVVFIDAGAQHSLAVRSDWTGWAWGRNDRGQLGTGAEFVDNSRPALLVRGICEPEGGCSESPLADVRQLRGGAFHTLALAGDRRVWSSGANEDGQLGRSGGDSFAFVVIEALSGVEAFDAGERHSLALTTAGELWAWGGNAEGQLGDCTTSAALQPSKIADAGLAFLGCQPPPAPAFDVAGGAYEVDEGLAVGVSAPGQGVVIRYTVDGTDPDESAASLAAGDRVWVAESITLKARAWAPHGAASEVTSAAYSLHARQPTFLPPGGAYFAAQQVAIESATPGATVHYTADGSQPSSASPVYVAGGLIDVATSSTLRAIAIPAQASWLASSTATAAYSLHLGVAPAPAFDPPPGTYSTTQAVSMSTIPGGVVHYTTDGTAPTAASPSFGGPISVDASVTLRAFVVHPDFQPGPRSTPRIA